MLPYERSFDWANDGGLIRPVELLVTGGSFLTSPQVTARPVITVSDCRQDGGSAVFGLMGVRLSSILWNGSCTRAAMVQRPW